MMRVEDIHGWRRFLAYLVVSCISYYAYDGDFSALCRIPQPEPPPDGILTSEVSACQDTVDHDNLRRRLTVSLVNRAAEHKRNSESLKKLRPYTVYVNADCAYITRLTPIAGLRRVSLDRNAVDPHAIINQTVTRNTGRLHSGNFLDSPPQLFIEALQTLTLCSGLSGIDSEE